MPIPFPDIDPVAVAIGPVVIRWYALAYLAGFLAGWKYVAYLAGLDKANPAVRKNDVDDFLPWMILGVILGGRIGYTLFYNFGMYMNDPLEVLKIWHGGMSFHGGAAGAIIAMFAYCMKRRIQFLHFTDLVCCAVPIGLFFGRIANFVNAELYGRLTDMPWGVVFPMAGDFPRHPSQLYEAALEGLLLFALMAVLVHRPRVRARAGVLSGLFLAGYGVSRAAVEFFREPDAQVGYIAGMFTMGQLLCVPMVAAGLYFIFRAKPAHAA